MSGHLRACSALSSGDYLALAGLEAGWAPELVWLVWKRKKLPPSKNWVLIPDVIQSIMQLIIFSIVVY